MIPVPKINGVHILTFLLAFCLAIATSWADDEEDAEPVARETPSEPAPAQPQQQRDNRPFEVFIPSEQISEDVPVPFPVDI